MADFLTLRPGANSSFIYPVIVTQTVGCDRSLGFGNSQKELAAALFERGGQ